MRLLSSGNLLEVHAFAAFERLWPTPAARLARAALLRHLTDTFDANAETALPALRVRAFDNFLSAQWESSRALVRPAAVLVACSAGLCFPATAPAPGLFAVLKKLAVFSLAREVPVYRLEELFYHSNAIFGNEYSLYAEARRLLSGDQRFWKMENREEKYGEIDSNGEKEEVSAVKMENLEKIVGIRSSFSVDKGTDEEKTETAFVFAIAECLKNCEETEARERLVADSKVLILCRLLQRRLPMKCRRLCTSFGEVPIDISLLF